MSPDIQELVIGTLKLMADTGLNSLVGRIFEKPKEEFFVKAVRTASAELNLLYGQRGKIDFKKLLTKSGIIEELKGFLLSPELTDIEKTKEALKSFDLPNNFIQTIRDQIFKQLMNDASFIQLFKQDITNFKLDLSTSLLESNLDATKEIKSCLEKIELSLSVPSSKAGDDNLPSKNIYKFENKHIQRELRALDSSYNRQTPRALVDLVKNEKRIVLLSIAGMGKTSELMHLASHYSNPTEFYYPVLIKLNIYSDEKIEELIEYHFPRWKTVKSERILLIFDGLDEVMEQHRNLFNRRLIKFSESTEYRDLRIVVSCRNNFYLTEVGGRKSQLEGFTSFILTDLNYSKTQRFIKESLGDKKAELFFSEIFKKDLLEIVKSPFFLCLLIELYEKDRHLPSNRLEVFEFFIQSRIEHDQNHATNNETNLLENEIRLRNQITKVALIAEIMGKNSITELELQQIINDNRDRSLLKYSFLFNRSSNILWSFEHNNFQEYLAAKALKNCDIDQILEIIAIPPNKTKIKASWVNTLSFLLLHLDKEQSVHKDLVRWIVVNEPGLLVQFEKDRIELSVREDIVLAILESYHSRGIVCRSVYFDIYKLGDFISDSERIVNYIIDKLQSCDKDAIVVDLAILVPRLELIQTREKEITEILYKICLSKEFSAHTRKSCLYSIADIGCEVELVDKLVNTMSLSSNQYTRAGLYCLILKSQLADKYIDWLLERLMTSHQQEVERDQGERSVTFGDLGYYLQECIKSLSTLESLVTFFDFSKNLVDSTNYDLHFSELVEECINKAKDCFPQDNKIFEAIFQIHLNLSRRHVQNIEPAIRDYLRVTGRVFTAFKKSLNLTFESDDALLVHADFLARIADQECIDYFLDSYVERKISDRQAFILRNYLNFNGSQYHSYYYQKLNQLCDNKFLYDPPKKSWEEIRIDRNKKDIALLQDSKIFLQSALHFFDFEEMDVITSTDMMEIKRETRRDESYDNNIIPDFFRLITEKEDVNRQLISNYLADEEKWEWYKVTKLLEYDTHNLLNLNKSEIDFITRWCKKKLATADFKGAFYLKDNVSWYRHLEHIIAYFIERFDLEIEGLDEVELLWVDSPYLPRRTPKDANDKPRSLFDFVLGRVDSNNLEKWVIDNLRSGIEVDIVLSRHIRYCQKLRLRECLPQIHNAIWGSTLTMDQKISAVRVYLELGGSPNEVDRLIEEIDNKDHKKYRFYSEFKGRVTEYLIVHLTSLTQNPEISVDDKINAAEFLISEGQLAGLEYLHQYTLEKQTYPSHWLNKDGVAKIEDTAALSLLIQMFEESFKQGFSSTVASSFDSDLITAIVEIGSKADSTFQQATEAFKLLIETREATFLHYQQEILESKYHSTKVAKLDLPYAINLYSQLRIAK